MSDASSDCIIFGVQSLRDSLSAAGSHKELRQQNLLSGKPQAIVNRDALLSLNKMILK